MQQKIIRQYYILSCLFTMGSTGIISAIYVSFLMKNGLDELGVNLINMTFYLTLFICEIPTGAFADIFGRKKSFVLACLLKCISLFVYGSSHTFVGFIVAEIIAAIAATFSSGAFQAWLVDSLKHHGYDGEYNHILGYEGWVKIIVGGLSAVMGSYLVTVHPYLPWLVGGIIMATTTILAHYMMKEDYFKKTVFSWKKGFTSMKEVAVSSIRYGTTNKAVRFILIVTCIQIFAIQPINMYWQPFFKDHYIKEQHLGFIYFGMTATLGCGAFVAARLKSYKNEKGLILNMQLFTGACILLATIVMTRVPLCGIFFFILHELPRGGWRPLMDNYLQKRIPSSERATISSFCSIAPHIGGVFGLLVSGIIAKYFGISTSWTVSAIVLIIGAILVSRNSKK